MPAKNSISKFHGRHPLINRKMWKKYNRESGANIEWKEFQEIISASLTETKKWILREPIGFKFPSGIGNIAVNKFKTYGDFKTYTNTRTAEGKAILNFNLHTGGDTFRIQWFHSTRNFTGRIPYWFFDASREFKRSLAKVLKSGDYPLYNAFMQDQFTTKKTK